MNLISCHNCGIVFDKDKLIFPSVYDDEGVTTSNAFWNGEEFISRIPCPVCQEDILEK